MVEVETFINKGARNQDHAMAEDGILFSTQQGKAVRFAFLLHSLNSPAESFSSCKTVISDLAVFIARLIFGACAQLLAKKHVCDVMRAQSITYGVPIELRI